MANGNTVGNIFWSLASFPEITKNDNNTPLEKISQKESKAEESNRELRKGGWLYANAEEITG